MRNVSDSNSIAISILKARYASGETTPREFISALREKIQKELTIDKNPVWIYWLSDSEVNEYLERLDTMNKQLPLYGVPFAIKDNIDLKNVPTTAGCEAFTYTPKVSAFVVNALIEAGAIPLGKTNLDQFATGLVGVRSPYGICRNALNSEYVSGGSSSGSAVAVAKNWVSFSLGTDTAGSGRVPASLNSLIGVKPTRGLLSCSGVVPACKSLDCVSIFTQSLSDANTVLNVASQFDEQDGFARPNKYSNGPAFGGKPVKKLCVGVPSAKQLEFYGDEESKSAFASAVANLREKNIEIEEIDFNPFEEAARLLYEGPWVAERYWACRDILENKPDAMLPVTFSIISAGGKPSAVSAFEAQYRLQELKQKADGILASVDCIMTPTNATEYTVEDVLQEPIKLNSNLGYYTNFMNLLDCAALAIPLTHKRNGVGFGVTLFHKAFSDKQLMGIAQHCLDGFGMYSELDAIDASATDETIDVVVCGAHLDGLPLNWQLRDRGAQKLRSTKTSAAYQFVALAGGPPDRPGLIRVEESGAQIGVEVWRMPRENLASFCAGIPAPLGLGKVELEDGSWLTGFICEAIGLLGSTDVTEHGDWRTYLNSRPTGK